MDFLDIIGKVIEFSEKGEEFSDEYSSFKATMMSLRITVKEIGEKSLPEHIIPMLTSSLKESQELLDKNSSVSSSWLSNFKNMLPGNALQKIKEKNQQLVHIINLLNLHLNTMKSKRSLDKLGTKTYEESEEPRVLKKMHTYSELDSREPLNLQRKSVSASEAKLDDIVYGATVPEESDDVLQGATQVDDAIIEEEDFAFKLRVLYDERLGSEIKDHKEFIPFIERRWDGNKVEYVFKRVDYVYLPAADIQKVSREHTTITAIRKSAPTKKMAIEDVNVAATVPDDDKFFGATIADEGEENGAVLTEDSNKTKYILKDLSLNGTYYIKGTELLNFPTSGISFKADFKKLDKNEETEIEHGDVFALIVKKPACKELVFGFQLLTE